MMYYAQRKSIKNGQPTTPNNRYDSDRRQMERQFHLYCASACANTDENDFDECEWGTLEQGIIERKTWSNPVEEPEEA